MVLTYTSLVKAIILAGGLGTRLRPVTYEIPKPLIPVHGKPLIIHVMDLLIHNGHVSEFVISIGYKAQMIQDNLGDSYEGRPIRYLVEQKRRGTGGWMHLADQHRYEEPFYVVNGDNLFRVDLQQASDQHDETDAAITLCLTNVDNPESYGIADLEGKQIKQFVEKPNEDEAPTNYANSGYYVFSPEVFERIPGSDRFSLEQELFASLAAEGRLYGYCSDQQWHDTGTMERWEDVLKSW
jgi:NDP-sugar pyrophosphorylase family protein